MYDNIIVPDVWFQFPARNSVCSDIACPPEGVRYIVVSIPRSEFCLFGPEELRFVVEDSIMFQFPARNSVCSDSHPALTVSM